MAIKKLSDNISSVYSNGGQSNKVDFFNSLSFPVYDAGNLNPALKSFAPTSNFLQIPNSAASQNHVADQFLVRFNPSMSHADRLAALKSIGADEAYTEESEANTGLMVGKVANPADLERVMSAIGNNPNVQFVEQNWIVNTQAVSNDPYYNSGYMWGMYGDKTTPANTYGSQAGEAWNAGYTGTMSTVVGIIDTGIDYTNPDLYLNVWINQKEISSGLRLALVDADQDGIITFRDLNNASNAAQVSDLNANGRIDAGDLLSDVRWNDGIDQDLNGYKDDLFGWDFVNNDNNPFDDNNHGTHVAGTIGGIGGNGIGVVGVNWSVEMMGLKFLDATGSGTTAAAVAALDYYTNISLNSAGTGQNFVATNNSWGGGGYSSSLYSAIVRTAQADNLFVAAAGNSAVNTDVTANYPSTYNTTSAVGFDAVISVAALTSSGGLASFSNYGATTVDLAAPGDTILSTLSGGGYGYMSGTSMATPHVTGALALYASLNASAGAAALRDALLNTTTAISSLASTTVSGARLDIGSLMAYTTTPSTGNYIGTSGNDTITGSSGNDTINGAGGIDNLDGLDASDIYLINLTSDHPAAEIHDSGTTGVDEVRFASTTASTLTLYSGDTGIEQVVIGTGTAATGVTSGTTALNVNAALLANAVTIIGNAGKNSLTGSAYDDVLDGRVGADTLIGGNGNDTYLVDNSADLITETASGGNNDSVFASVSYVLAANVENLMLLGSAVSATGNVSNNLIIGNSAKNVLDGKAGIDILDGKEGSDIYLIGLASDHPVAEINDSGVSGIDEVRFAATSASTLNLYAGDIGIEKVVVGTGTAATAVTTGSTALNVNASAVNNGLSITGNGGANSLIGTAYGDILSGGNGNDTLTGGAGSDLFVFNTAANAKSNLETITDFVSGTDKLQLSKAIFSGLGSSIGNLAVGQFWSATGATSGHDADDRLIYNTTTGALYYDADGSGRVSAVQIALIGTATHPNLAYTDIQIIA